MRSILAAAGILLLTPQQTRTDPGVMKGQHPISDRRISESSAVVASRKYPGRLWTLNDSGGNPVIFAIDSAGNTLNTMSVRNAKNRDWEALALGPCPAGSCLYIGDTGDNGERRRTATIYRVAEPAPLPGGQNGITGEVSELEVRYQDGRHDAEAMYVEPDGSVIIVTKGRRGGVRTYRVPPAAWTGTGPGIAMRVDSLPIPASLSAGRVVTDAAIRPDGREVAVRTYFEVWFFARGLDGHLQLDRTRPVCAIPLGAERQGEGIDYWNSSTLVLTSERGVRWREGTIWFMWCPDK